MTVFWLSSIYYIWNGEIDLEKTLTKPLASFVSFKKKTDIDIDIKQINFARFKSATNSQSGSYAVMFYNLHFVNTSDASLTLKALRLRVGNGPDIDATGIVTGTVENKKDGPKIASALMRSPAGNFVIMGWRDIREVIGEYKILAPGAVLEGSAVFVLDMLTKQDIEKLKSLKVVAIDFSGNKTVKEIEIAPLSIQGMDAREIVSDEFEIDKDGQWK